MIIDAFIALSAIAVAITLLTIRDSKLPLGTTPSPGGTTMMTTHLAMYAPAEGRRTAS